jgi:hypothetical protein
MVVIKLALNRSRQVAVRQLELYTLSMGLEIGDLVELPYDPGCYCTVGYRCCP